MSYESPIELFQTEPILEQIKSETDAYILKSVWKFGVNVHKDELIKALAYDRDQYDKGFHDGRMYQPPVMTNADLCRSYSDEQLAELFNQIETEGRAYGPRGKAQWLKWLKQECET